MKGMDVIDIRRATAGRRVLLAVITAGVALPVCLAALGVTRARAQAVSTVWEQPVVLFDAEQAAQLFSPLVIEDSEGGIKVLWETTTASAAQPAELTDGIYCVEGDGRNWSVANDVIVAPSGGRTFWPRHALDAQGQLHLVWVGPNAMLYHSRAPSALACDARSWETTQLPVRDQALHGDIEVDDEGVLHVVYAARGQDVYYMRSEDEGQSWSNPVAVSSVEPAEATAFPGLAIDPQGRIHVVWEAGQLPDGLPSLGLFYAGSQDGGQSWSAPRLFSQLEGAYTEPEVIAPADGTVHILWNGRAGTGGRYHQYSADGGATWSAINDIMARSMGGGQTGPPAVAVDSAGRLHMATGTDETSYAAWDGHNWSPAYDIASYDEFGNMEHQSIAVARGNELYVAANGNGLRQILLIRGVTVAPEVVSAPGPSPAAAPQATPLPASAAEQPTSAPAPAGGTLSPELAGPPAADDPIIPILLSSGVALLTVAVAVALGIGRRRH